jgi:hypothetical protein
MKFNHISKAFLTASIITLSSFVLSSSIVREGKASTVAQNETPIEEQYIIKITDDIDGDWKITWRANKFYYVGNLKLKNGEGTMTVDVRKGNSIVKTLKEEMVVTPDGSNEKSYVLEATKVEPSKNYTPDKFYVEVGDDGRLNIRHDDPSVKNEQIEEV